MSRSEEAGSSVVPSTGADTRPSSAPTPPPVGLIADIVASRGLEDRAAAQKTIHAAFAQAHEVVLPRESAWATVGDEFQAVYLTWQDAVRATLRLMVELPEGLRLRCGLGEGEISDVEPGAYGPIQEGQGWLHARAAVDEAAARQGRRDETVSWFSGTDPVRAASVNAHLLLRDHIVFRMKARERRLCAVLLAGGTQKQAAAQERISQSAVSQSLHRSGGAALVELDRVLAESGLEPDPGTVSDSEPV